MIRIRRRTLLALASTELALGCAKSATVTSALHKGPAPSDTYVFSWVSAQQLVEPGNHPPAPLSGTTLRQRLLLSVGGARVRLTLSNEYGENPLEIRGAHVAFPGDRENVVPNTGGALTFGGSSSTVIPQGRTVVSDPLAFEVTDGVELAVTLNLGSVPLELSGHPGSRTTSFIWTAEGPEDGASRPSTTTDHWYFISGVEVAPAKDTRVLVILGDSITDGRGSTTNENDRYPNLLARRFQERKEGPRTAVLNQGIGGNRVLRGGLGPTVLERYERDALYLPGARALLLFAGINDLGAHHGKAPEDPDQPRAEELISAFTKIANDCRTREVKILAATLLPFEGSFYFTDEGEAHRQAFNDWIRTTEVLDGFVDFDAVTRDPHHPTRLAEAIDGGDHLHPSASGYAVMAKAMDLDLFD